MPLPFPSCTGQHDDSRMCLTIALTAIREGATVANHVEVLSLIKENVRFECTVFYVRGSETCLST